MILAKLDIVPRVANERNMSNRETHEKFKQSLSYFIQEIMFSG